jgi:hypothetical protein
VAVRNATLVLGGHSHQGATPAGERFATSVAGGNRHLLDQTGQAWFGVGDTAWSLTVQLSPAEITDYLEDRAGRGVNLVLVNLVEHFYGDNAPNNYSNAAPFTGTPFQSSLGSSYWSVIDHAVSECERLGITLLACPAYLGASGTEEGWDTEVAAASNGQMATYGQALDSRYGSSPNVVWLIGHDKVPSSTEKAREEAMAAELAGLCALGAFHQADILGSPPWGSTTVAPDVETVYSYEHTPVDNGLTAWAASPTRPWIWFEGVYENEQSVTATQLRAQTWGALVAGATAVIFGNNPIWRFDTGWESALDDTGSLHHERFATFVAGLGTRWAATAADTTGTFLTGGAQTGASRAGARFGTSTAVVYMPSARAVTLDLSEISAHAQARVTRVDPTSGATSVIGTYATSGGQGVASQGSNASGASDWVLLVEGV